MKLRGHTVRAVLGACWYRGHTAQCEVMVQDTRGGWGPAHQGGEGRGQAASAKCAMAFQEGQTGLPRCQSRACQLASRHRGCGADVNRRSPMLSPAAARLATEQRLHHAGSGCRGGLTKRQPSSICSRGCRAVQQPSRNGFDVACRPVSTLRPAGSWPRWLRQPHLLAACGPALPAGVDARRERGPARRAGSLARRLAARGGWPGRSCCECSLPWVGAQGGSSRGCSGASRRAQRRCRARGQWACGLSCARQGATEQCSGT